MFAVLVAPLFAFMSHAPADEAWIERLELPELVSVEIQFGVTTGELGMETGYDLGFEGDSQEMVDDARQRLGEGELEARLLHQLLLGMYRSEELEEEWEELGEDWLEMLELCAAVYWKELEAEPDSVALRMGLAGVLELGFLVTNSPGFFDLALEQCEEAAALDRGDWRIPSEMAKLCFVRFMKTEQAGAWDEWREAGVGYARDSISAAPNEGGPHLQLFFIQYFAIVREGGSDMLVHLAAAADELADSVAVVDDAELLGVCAEAFWLSVCLPGLVDPDGQEAPAEGWPEMPGEADEVVERLHALRAMLAEAPEGEVVARAALVCLIACLLSGESVDWEDVLEEAVEAGADVQEALIAGLGVCQRSGCDALEAELVERLEAEAEEDNSFYVLTSFHAKAGDHERALECLEQVQEEDSKRALVRGVLLLRTGASEAALTVLEELAEDPPEQAGYYAHALGVALALAGRHAEALEQLQEASELLEEGEGVEETIEEVRDLIGE